MYSNHANDLWACGKAFRPATTVEAFQTVASLCVLDLALPDHRLLEHRFGCVNPQPEVLLNFSRDKYAEKNLEVVIHPSE